MSKFDCVILKNHLTNRLNILVRCYNNENKKVFIIKIKNTTGIDVSESIKSYQEFKEIVEKIRNSLHPKGLLIDYDYYLKCLYHKEKLEKMFTCVNCKKVRLVEIVKNRFIEDRDNKIFRIFKNYKNDYFPVCINCVNDGKSFVTKLNKYFFPVKTISYDKFQRIHFNRKESRHFKKNYYASISDDGDSRYEVLSNLGI